MWHRRRLLPMPGVVVLCAVGTAILPSFAQQLPAPHDRVVLTVTGALGKADASGRVEFDLNAIERLGLAKLIAWTPWTDGEVEFEGVWARRLMAAVGARGTEVEARALNDYIELIPLEDFERYDVLLATRMKGQLLRVRDKGPIWIVYPWSAHPELDDYATREKSVWQLSALHVR